MFMGKRTRPGNEHNKAHCLPISLDSDVIPGGGGDKKGYEDQIPEAC